MPDSLSSLLFTQSGRRDWHSPIWRATGVPAEGETIGRHTFNPDYKIDHETGCWLWQRSFDKAGYGQTNGCGGIKYRKAHREYYYRATGTELTSKMHVHHKCHTPACVNPDHLEVKGNRVHMFEHWVEWSPITPEVITAIRADARAEPHTTFKEIAARYGVTHQNARKIVLGLRWQGVGVWPPPAPPKMCLQCGNEVIGKRRDARFCGDLCIKAWQRDEKRRKKAAERQAA